MKNASHVLSAAIRRFDFPSAFGARSSSRPDKVILARCDEVIRLEKSSFVKTIIVSSGVVWLTGASLDGDVLLMSGGQFELSDHWPYVIQALEPAELSLH